MSLKSEMYCPTSENAKKVTVEDTVEKLAKRELRRKIKLEQNKVIITTGDNVSDIIWTKEKLDELQYIVDKIKEEERENVRYLLELSDTKVTDNQWNQIKNAAEYLENNINDLLQD